MNTLHIISGMSGAGKTETMRQLMDNELISVTTRNKRKYEQDGIDYFFITDEEYDKLFSEGKLAESLNYDNKKYGITYDELNKKLEYQDAFAIVTHQGMLQLKNNYPKCSTIFIYADYNEVERRMRLRGESEQTISSRLSTYHEEMKNAQLYDYIVKNKDGEFDKTVNIVKNILLAEQTKLRLKRKSWDEYFMDIAETVATRATCDRLHVGCVIVKDKRIISTGYNGSIHGEDHCDDVGHLYNEQGRCVRTIHAEQNAIIHANREDLKGATAYVSHEPCETCTKLLIQAGIKRIIFKHGYQNKYNHNFTKNVEWIQL